MENIVKKIISVAIGIALIVFFIANFFLFMTLIGLLVFFAVGFMIFRYFQIKRILEKNGVDMSSSKGRNFYFYQFRNMNFNDDFFQENYKKYNDYPEDTSESNKHIK